MQVLIEVVTAIKHRSDNGRNQQNNLKRVINSQERILLQTMKSFLTNIPRL